jgi:hypothetical protein
MKVIAAFLLLAAANGLSIAKQQQNDEQVMELKEQLEAKDLETEIKQAELEEAAEKDQARIEVLSAEQDELKAELEALTDLRPRLLVILGCSGSTYLINIASDLLRLHNMSLYNPDHPNPLEGVFRKIFLVRRSV